MIAEYATIKVKRYRTPDGNPTCCADQPAGLTCRFLGVRGFGLVTVCMLGQEHRIEYSSTNNSGYLQPHDGCEVWKKENSKVFQDGNEWCCIGIDFEDLQASDNYAFGETREAAIENYGKLMLRDA